MKRLTETSQRAKILRVLQDAAATGDPWVAMPALVLVSGSYNIHSRIDELRQCHGYDIENRTDVSVRPHRSEYRLISAPPLLGERAGVRAGVTSPDTFEPTQALIPLIANDE